VISMECKYGAARMVFGTPHDHDNTWVFYVIVQSLAVTRDQPIGPQLTTALSQNGNLETDNEAEVWRDS